MLCNIVCNVLQDHLNLFALYIRQPLIRFSCYDLKFTRCLGASGGWHVTVSPTPIRFLEACKGDHCETLRSLVQLQAMA